MNTDFHERPIEELEEELREHRATWRSALDEPPPAGLRRRVLEAADAQLDAPRPIERALRWLRTQWMLPAGIVAAAAALSVLLLDEQTERVLRPAPIEEGHPAGPPLMSTPDTHEAYEGADEESVPESQTSEPSEPLPSGEHEGLDRTRRTAPERSHRTTRRARRPPRPSAVRGRQQADPFPGLSDAPRKSQGDAFQAQTPDSRAPSRSPSAGRAAPSLFEPRDDAESAPSAEPSPSAGVEISASERADSHEPAGANLDALVADAERAFRQADWELATRLYQRLLRENPSDPRAPRWRERLQIVRSRLPAPRP